MRGQGLTECEGKGQQTRGRKQEWTGVGCRGVRVGTGGRAGQWQVGSEGRGPGRGGTVHL